MSRAMRSLERGRTARASGDLREAARLSGEAFRRFQRRGDEAGMASALVEVAVVALAGGDEETASRAAGEALALAGSGDPVTVSAAVTVVARLAVLGDDAESSVRLFAGAGACGLSEASLAMVREQVGGAVLQRSRDLVGAGRVAALEAEGAQMTRVEVVALARARGAR